MLDGGVLALASVYSSLLVHTSVVKAEQQNLEPEEEGSVVGDVVYPLEEDREALQTAFGGSRSLPLVTIPGSVVKARAQSSKEQQATISSVMNIRECNLYT